MIGFENHKFEGVDVFHPPADIQLFDEDMKPFPPANLAGARALREMENVGNVLYGIQLPNNPIRWVRASASLIYDDGEFLGVVVVIRDITERHNMFRRLMAYARSAAHVSDTTTDNRQRLQSLSPRQKEVLHYLTKGLSNEEIAEILRIEEKTVRSHISKLLKKLGCMNRVQAVLMAQNGGLDSLMI
jgi:DNA-binding CsgD family transcriptional regulator